MDQLLALRLFVRVVESGSFSAAAREAGLGQPAVSKQITALETHLGAQLLRRTSRSLSLTDAGQDFYESSLRLLDDLETAEQRIGRGQTTPSGLIRVSVAPMFGRLYIVPRLGAFFSRYPEVSVDLVVTDRVVNLVEEGIDLSIHNGPLKDSTLVARRIATTPIVTVASPAYLNTHGEPQSPQELERHHCVIYAPLGLPRAWGFKGDLEIQPNGNFRTNDADQIRAAVLSELGLAHAPGWLFAREIATGAVRRVLRAYEPIPLAISAVHAAGRRLSTKVRVFIEFLAERFAGESDMSGLP